MHLERDFSLGGFEPVPGYRESQDSPFIVVPQTSAVLELLLRDETINPEPARQFLNEATFPYLARAKQGLEIVSDLSGEKSSFSWAQVAESHIDPQDKENIEALGHMLVVFAFMPETPSKILPKGFSRRGNLRPPETTSQFSDRVEELRVTVFNISQGQLTTRVPLEFMKPPVARTVAFFRTGSWLPLKVPDGTNGDRSEFEKILRDIEINFD